MEFEWDPTKAAANLEKHGISFLGAVTIWDGPVIASRSDQGGEARWKAIGVLNARLVAVIYTIREGRYRIISARRARDNERRAYRQVYP